MIEQSEVEAGASAPRVSAGRALPAEVRASLEAVRMAREAARLRGRRETVKARISFAVMMGAVALAAAMVGPRVVRWRHARAHAKGARAASLVLRHETAPVAAPAPAPVAAPAPAPIAAPETVAAPMPPVVATAPAPVAVPESAATSLPSVAAAGESRGRGGPGADCDVAHIRKSPWLLSPDACVRAFETDPNNASLALAIAHSMHVRGRFADAASWAKRALALDPKRAEAYILIARADAQAGHDDDARASYRRYLELAPRGWHKTEARNALSDAR